MKTQLGKEGFIQINIIVKDIKKAAQKWAELLGMEAPEIRSAHLEGSTEYPYEYRGNPDPCDLLVCNIDMGGFVIELHQPVGGPSTFEEFLRAHGNGVHHLGFEAGTKRDDIVAELQAEGYPVRTVGYYPGSSWTIMDTEEDYGVNLNIKPIR